MAVSGAVLTLLLWCAPLSPSAVVTLFNAIRNQQKVLDVGEVASGSGKAAAPVAKKTITLSAKDTPKQSFLSLLKSTSSKQAGSGTGDAETPSTAAAGGAVSTRGKRSAAAATVGDDDDDDDDDDSDSEEEVPVDAGRKKKKWAVLDDGYKMSARSKDWRGGDSSSDGEAASGSDADDE